MVSWADGEVLKLIELWSEESIQVMLEGSKRNCDVFNKISLELESAGFQMTGEPCNCKIRKLKLGR